MIMKIIILKIKNKEEKWESILQKDLEWRF